MANFDFQDGRAVRHIGFVVDHPQRAFGGLYRCIKCGSFDVAVSNL